MGDLWEQKNFQQILESLRNNPKSVPREEFFHLFPQWVAFEVQRKNFEFLAQALQEVQRLPIWTSFYSFEDTLDSSFSPKWQQELPRIWMLLLPKEQRAFLEVFSLFPPSRIPDFLYMAAHAKNGDPFYKIVESLAKRDSDILLECLASSDQELSYHAHIVFRRLTKENHLLFQRILKLQNSPHSHTRKYTVSLLRSWKSPTAKRKLAEFLLDKDPEVRRAVLLIPEKLAAPTNYDFLFQTLEKASPPEWTEEDLIQLQTALFLSDPPRAWQWVDQIFRQKDGLFRNRKLYTLKVRIIETILRGTDEFYFDWAGKLLEADTYHLPEGSRGKLIRFREKTRIRRQNSEAFSKEEIQKIWEKTESSQKDRELTELEKQPVEGKTDIMVAKNFSSKPSKEKLPRLSDLENVLEREISSSPTQDLSEEVQEILALERKTQEERAKAPTESLEEEIRLLGKTAKQHKNLEEALSRLEQAVSGLSKKPEEKSQAFPLFLIFAKELYQADTGRFLKTLRNLFHKNLLETEEKEVLLEWMTCLTDHSVELFLDYLYHTHLEKIPENLQPKVREYLQSRGLIT